jgi:acetyl esterase/lipase
VPSYVLAPQAQWPSQLRQGLDALQYITRKTGRNPGQVIIGGDSAGGNLVLAILSHLSHPYHHDHDQIGGSLLLLPPSISLAGPLGGAITMGPWVNFDKKWPSQERNKYKDMVTTIPTCDNSRFFLGDDQKRDNYTEPLRAPPTWWEGVMARRVLLMAGGDEIMLDPQKEFFDKFAVSYTLCDISLPCFWVYFWTNSTLVTFFSSLSMRTRRK